MSTGEPPDPQEPKEAPAIKTGTVAESAAANPKLIAWLKLNWKAIVPWLAFGASVLIAVGSFVQAGISRAAIDVGIRDEYEKRRQAMESELRADMRQIRSEMSTLRERIDDVLDCGHCSGSHHSPVPQGRPAPDPPNSTDALPETRFP